MSQGPPQLRIIRLIHRSHSWVSEKAGVNEAVVFSLLARGWGVISGVVMIWLITTRLSPELQGYYYTFAGLIVFQTFLELGFGVVLVQFISHEWAFLRLNPNDGGIEGDPDAAWRLASLVRLGIVWYLAVAVLFFMIVGGAGDLVLAHHVHSAVSWRVPWWLLCGAVLLSILLVPLRCFIEGSNQVGKSQRIALFVGVCSGVLGWLAIVLGAGLYTLAVIAGATAIVGHSLFLYHCRPFFRLLTLNGWKSRPRIAWKKQFWPQQWRIGISWLSGLLMFQSFVPIMFYLRGPVPAGQLGVTLQVYNAVNLVASSWLVAAGPAMGMLASARQFWDLRRVVGRTIRQSVLACSFLSGGAFLGVGFLRWLAHEYSRRFGDLVTLCAFLIVVIVIQVANVETAAIRFQKKEPFVVNSITGAALVTLSNVVLGRYFGMQGVAVGFACIMLIVVLPWVHTVYSREMARSELG